MQTVRDESGRRYLLLKRADEASLVRDPETGEKRHVPNESLEPVEGASPLETASRAAPSEVRRILTAVHDDRSLGLLFELDARGPLAVTTLLESTSLCESDLHGLVGELQAADLLAETTVAGVRGYEVTAAAERGLAALRADEGGD